MVGTLFAADREDKAPLMGRSGFERPASDCALYATDVTPARFGRGSR